MRRTLVCAFALLTFVPAAAGTPSGLTVQAAPLTGPAPLQVTFAASGDAASYHWDFGDGASADGPAVEHTYTAGRWTAVVSARSSDGDVTTQTVGITASGLTLSGKSPARYGRRTIFRGAVIPAESGLAVSLTGPKGRIAQGRTAANGGYVLRAHVNLPGEYVATSARGSSTPLSLRVVPRLVTKLAGSAARGGRYFFAARVVPRSSGTLAVKVSRGQTVVVDRSFRSSARLRLDTHRLVTYRIRVEVHPSEGYAGISRVVRAHVVLPRLGYGARGANVAQLGQRLRALHYVAPASAVFDGRMLDGVYAFQKLRGLPRTGVVDARFWRALDSSAVPRPRYGGPADHLEVDKGHQVLLVVRRGRVALVAPISTAGLPGTFTPVGRFSVYRKVSGFDPSPLGTLYDPMYFTGGYAIHGNPSVPPYPASHGCVRVPMWVAPYLYATTPYGQTVYVY